MEGVIVCQSAGVVQAALAGYMEVGNLVRRLRRNGGADVEVRMWRVRVGRLCGDP